MTRPLPPPPPDHLPETVAFPRSSRYQRPRRLFSWWGIFIGLVIGLTLGLFYAWQIAPLEEFDTQPRQLRRDDKMHYAVGIVLAFAYDSDLPQAINRLLELNLGIDPLQEVAVVACDLARSGYVDSNSGLRAVRAMQTFYRLQGRSGCADVLIPDVEVAQVVEIDVPTATPSLPPPPSKTPTPGTLSTPTPDGVVIVPTSPPRRDFEGRIASTFCDVELSGLIEVFVQAPGSVGIPGLQVRVRWDGGEDRFVTGLKPERGPAYADFQMTAGIGYTIDMPGRSNPIATPLVGEPCFTEGGREAIKSYRVVFQRTG